MTLRDLFMMLSPEYAQKWRQQKAQEYKLPGINDSTPMGLQEQLYWNNPDLGRRMENVPPNIWSIEEYIQNMQRQKPPIKGML